MRLVAKRFRTWAVFAAALLAGLALGGTGVAQDKVVDLRISLWVPPADPLMAAFEAWGRSIGAASKGTITHKVSPAQQLGKARDHYDMARDGVADVTFVDPSFQPGRFPVIEAAALPLLASNAKDGSTAIDEWYRPYASKEMKDVKYCLAFAHGPGVWHARKKIADPTDLRGLKTRAASPVVASLVKRLGGTNMDAPAAEIRQLLARGALDAVTLSWGSFLLFKVDQAAKYHLDLPLYLTPFAIVMNRASYDGMSESQRKVIDDHCTSEWAKKIAGPWADREAAGREQVIRMSGHEVVRPSNDQTSRWRKTSDPLIGQWARLAGKAGWTPDVVLAGLKASLAGRNATMP